MLELPSHEELVAEAECRWVEVDRRRTLSVRTNCSTVLNLPVFKVRSLSDAIALKLEAEETRAIGRLVMLWPSRLLGKRQHSGRCAPGGEYLAKWHG